MKYGVMSETSDGRRTVLQVGMSLLDAEQYMSAVAEDGERAGYLTKFSVVAIEEYPVCAKCGLLCVSCQGDQP
jgi:hypothetical protein